MNRKTRNMRPAYRTMAIDERQNLLSSSNSGGGSDHDGAIAEEAYSSSMIRSYKKKAGSPHKLTALHDSGGILTSGTKPEISAKMPADKWNFVRIMPNAKPKQQLRSIKALGTRHASQPTNNSSSIRSQNYKTAANAYMFRNNVANLVKSKFRMTTAERLAATHNKHSNGGVTVGCETSDLMTRAATLTN